jgi:hypothetical protein
MLCLFHVCSITILSMCLRPDWTAGAVSNGVRVCFVQVSALEDMWKAAPDAKVEDLEAAEVRKEDALEDRLQGW